MVFVSNHYFIYFRNPQHRLLTNMLTKTVRETKEEKMTRVRMNQLLSLDVSLVKIKATQNFFTLIRS